MQHANNLYAKHAFRTWDVAAPTARLFRNNATAPHHRVTASATISPPTNLFFFPTRCACTIASRGTVVLTCVTPLRLTNHNSGYHNYSAWRLLKPVVRVVWLPLPDTGVNAHTFTARPASSPPPQYTAHCQPATTVRGRCDALPAKLTRQRLQTPAAQTTAPIHRRVGVY